MVRARILSTGVPTALLFSGLLLPAAAKPLYNGMSFNGLDGFHATDSIAAKAGAANEKFCYVLDHLSDSAVAPRLRSTFAAYRDAGVNLIRIPIHPGRDLGCDPAEYGEDLYNGGGLWDDGRWHDHWPLGTEANRAGPRRERIRTFNAFMRLASEYGLACEIQFQSIAMSGDLYTDTVPAAGVKYAHEKAWIAAWMRALDTSRIAVVNLVQEAFIHSRYPKPGGTYALYPRVPVTDPWYARTRSQAEYVIDLWNWFRAEFRGRKATAEIWTMGWDSTAAIAGLQYRADSALIAATADWIGRYLPGLSYAGLETYFHLPAKTAGPEEFLATANGLLSAYFHSAFYRKTKTPLWIDEFGHAVCASVGDDCPCGEASQTAYYYALLTATDRYSGREIAGRVSWVGTNDQPYDGKEAFGLLKGYRGNVPVTRPAWKWISSSYPAKPSAAGPVVVPLLPLQ
jgi:hypothetical protein